MAKQVALIILDGWGYREEIADNAVATAKTPHFDHYWNTYPHTLLEASGEAVGLPEGQVGNSEVGHMTIGAGRTLDTDLVRIGKTIRENSFGQLGAFGQLFEHVQKHDSAVHVLGLLGTGGVHAHHDHLVAFLHACKEKNISKVYLHVFTDGRDTAPQSAATFLKMLEHELATIGVGRIATMTGRFYAMDRDSNWDRLTKAEEALFEGKGVQHHLKPSEIMEALHTQGVYDERMEPVVITDADGTAYPIQKNDGVFFFNFRADRARMLTESLLKQKEDKNLFIVTMTQYSSKYDVAVAFPPEVLQTTLAQEVSHAGMTQAHIAETEKFPHATYFLNGGKEDPHEGEEHVLLKSRKDVPTHDLAPKMRAEGIADEAIKRIEEGVNFIFINFANPDMVGHTANVPAIIEALEETDTQLARVVQVLIKNDGIAIITADHGNAEVNFDTTEKVPHTAHTLNKVPCIITTEGVKLNRWWRSDLACSHGLAVAQYSKTANNDREGDYEYNIRVLINEKKYYEKMSCAVMGGPCDEMIVAETKEEMMTKAMDHVKMAHPEMVAGIEAMTAEENAAWQEKFDKAWEEAEVVDEGPSTPKEMEEEKKKSK